MSPKEYLALQKQDRVNFLNLCAYTTIVLKVKSERLTGGAGHYFVGADRRSHKRPMEQIKEKVLE